MLSLRRLRLSRRECGGTTPLSLDATCRVVSKRRHVCALQTRLGGIFPNITPRRRSRHSPQSSCTGLTHGIFRLNIPHRGAINAMKQRRCHFSHEPNKCSPCSRPTHGQSGRHDHWRPHRRLRLRFAAMVCGQAARTLSTRDDWLFCLSHQRRLFWIIAGHAGRPSLYSHHFHFRQAREQAAGSPECSR